MGVKKSRTSIKLWSMKAGLMKFQMGTKTAGNWARGHSCNTLTKNLAVFCPHFKILSESKLKNNGLSCLVEIISRY